MTGRRVAVSVLWCLWVYVLAGWVYIAVIAAFKPHDLAVHVTTWLPLRRDTFGALCFLLSGVLYFGLNLLPAQDRSRP